MCIFHKIDIVGKYVLLRFFSGVRFNSNKLVKGVQCKCSVEGDMMIRGMICAVMGTAGAGDARAGGCPGAGGASAARECGRECLVRSSRNNHSISVAPPPAVACVTRPGSAGAARAPPLSHYPLTIRNRPTSWLLDLGYNDLTSAK